MTAMDVERTLRSQLRQANTEANRLREINAELLAALKAVCERALLNRDDWDGSARVAVHQAYDVIAKAEGKAAHPKG